MGLAAKLPRAHRWVVFLTSYLLMALFAVSFQVLPPLQDFIRNDIPMTRTQVGYLMGAFTVPGLLMPPFAPWLAAKFNDRRVIVFSLGLMVVGNALFALSGSFLLLMTGRVIAGVGANVVMTLGPLIIITLFRKEVGRAVGVFNTAVPLGNILTLNLFAWTGAAMGWRPTAWGVAGACLLLLVVHLFPLDLPGEKKKEDAGEPEVTKGLDGKKMLLLIVPWLIVNAQTTGYNVFAPELFQLLGYTQQGAKGWTSVYIIESIVVSPIIGWIVDRRGWKKLLLVLANVIMSTSFFFLSVPFFYTRFWAVLFGLGAAVIPVAVFALLADQVRPRYVSKGIAFLIVAANIGGIVGPAGFGMILDMGGGFGWGFRAMALLSVITLLLVWKIPGKLTD